MTSRPLRTDPRDGAALSLPAGASLARSVVRTLVTAGHEAAVVGGGLRDLLLGLEPVDWDVATSARPEVVVSLFPRTTWQNRFGTVTVHGAGVGEGQVQVTTYRAEGGYTDRRRPDDVRFGVSLEDDLARRDFTINAVAWLPADRDAEAGRLIDPHRGIEDLEAGVLRSVGDPVARLAEDALRVLRAIRFAHRLGLVIDPSTEAAIIELAPSAASVAGERLRDELGRILAADAGTRAGASRGPAPAAGLELAERLGVLRALLPEVAALRGVPQAKALPGDALDHTLRAVDASDPAQPLVRWAALLHDIGKAETLADGHFLGHETLGAEMTGAILARLRFPRAAAAAVVHAVRHHMFAYDAQWSDAAVRRFVRRVGENGLPLLFALRRADDVASGAGERGAAELADLERRIASVEPAPARLALDGNDLMRELDLEPGPRLGALVARLHDAVVDDPSRNERDTLLRLARQVIHER